jgi:hypothetical protein
MEHWEIQPWLFVVEPYEGESLSHFLGRFRRENDLTPAGLGREAEIGGVISRWEKFRLIPFPSQQELEKLAEVVQVDTARLRAMLPPAGVGMKMTPIRLCGACYGEVPCHRMEWQYKTTDRCQRHSLRLLSECPNCGARFPVPALWQDGWCTRCFTTFGEMAGAQRSL